tara:strand:- start:4349 stop:6538 length:2190 start_codon:yes stop_codon:yes gene_type:complete
MAEMKVQIGVDATGLDNGLDKASASVNKFGQATKEVGKTATRAGKQVRTNAVPAMTSFSQVIQDAPYGIRGVANNITQLTMQMGHLSKNAGGTGNALKSMLTTLAGPAGILLAVSVVTSLLVSYGDKLSFGASQAEKLKMKQEELTKSLKEYEEGLLGVQKAELKGSKSSAKELVNLKLLKAQIDDTSLSQNKRVSAVDEITRLYPSYFKGVKKESLLTGSLTPIYNKLTEAILLKAKAQAAASLITANAKKELTLQMQLELSRLKIAQLSARQKKIEANESKRSAIDKNITGGLASANQKELNAEIASEKKLVTDITSIQDESLKLAKKIKDIGGIVPLDFDEDEDKDDKVSDGIDLVVSRIKLQMAKLNESLTGGNLDFSDRIANLMQQFTKESELINAEYKQKEIDAKGNAVKLQSIENDKQTALLNLKKKYNTLGLKQAQGNIKQELAQIQLDGKSTTKSQLDALLLRYQAMGALTREQEQNYRNEKEQIQADGNNAYLLKQNEYLNQLLTNENLNGALRLEIEKLVQANLLAVKNGGVAKLQELAGQSKLLINQEFADTAAAIGDALGNALVSGGNVIESLGGVLLSSLGGVLVKLGKMAIATGIGLEAIKKALQNPFTGGIASIGAGIALVALGSAFKAGAQGLTSGGGGGGGSSSAGSTSSGVSGGSTSSRSYGSSTGGGGGYNSGGGTVVFEIAGQKLVGVLSNTLKRNQSMGGNLTITTG